MRFENEIGLFAKWPMGISLLICATGLIRSQTENNQPGSLFTIQSQLTASGDFFGTPDGMLTKETERAIRRFQIRTGLPVTGNLDEPTEAAIKKQATEVVVRAERTNPGSAGPGVGDLGLPGLPTTEAGQSEPFLGEVEPQPFFGITEPAPPPFPGAEPGLSPEEPGFPQAPPGVSIPPADPLADPPADPLAGTFAGSRFQQAPASLRALRLSGKITHLE